MFSSAGPGRGTFDKNLEKATSQLLLEPDWDATLQICDAVRQKDVTPKYAVQAIKKKFSDKNPRVVLYALQVLESVVKNCGSGIHDEVATGPVMNEMKDLVTSSNDAVKNKSKELLQAWAHAFRNEQGLKIVIDTFNQLKTEGHSFPELKESDAMFVAERAPEWADGERCYNCRAEFGVIQRKHHCRHCGQVFCSKCTSKTCAIPKFGIERPVRVCDSCYSKLTGKSTSSDGSKETDLPPEYLNSPLSQQSQLPPKRSEQELQEEEELQLALALSLDEEQNKHIIKKDKDVPSSVTTAPSAPGTTYSTTSAPAFEQELDPELARYLNRNYWEQKHEEQQSATAPSAPGTNAVPATAPPMLQATSSEPHYSQSGGQAFNAVQQNGDNDEEQFIRAMSGSIDVLVNRMKSDSSRGRSIASDTTVQGLFQTLLNMQPRLLKALQEREGKRAHMESLQDKLAQVRDAREALDALREEHREKLRREAEEAERQRQIQLAQKLEVMRRKKEEMLQFRRQQALMQMQQQEQERAMWLEQQKQAQQMRQLQYTAFPGQYGPPQPYGSPSHMPYGAPPQGYQMQPPSGPMGSMDPSSQQMPPSGYPQPGPYQQPPSQQPGTGDPGQYASQGPTPSYPSSQYQQPPTSMSQPGHSYTPLSSMDYQSQAFNMQSMSNALPNQPQQPNMPPPNMPQTGSMQQPQMNYQPGVMYPQQGYVPQAPPGMHNQLQQPSYVPQQQQLPPQQQQLPPQQQQLPPQQQQQPPPPQAQPPAPQEQQDATLISFD